VSEICGSRGYEGGDHTGNDHGISWENYDPEAELERLGITRADERARQDAHWESQQDHPGDDQAGNDWDQDPDRENYADLDGDINAILSEDDDLPDPRTQQQVACDPAQDQAPTLAETGARADDPQHGDDPGLVGERDDHAGQDHDAPQPGAYPHPDAGKFGPGQEPAADSHLTGSRDFGPVTDADQVLRQRVADLESANTRLESTNAELKSENAQLVRGLAELASETARLGKDMVELKADNAQLTKDLRAGLKHPEQDNADKEAIEAADARTHGGPGEDSE
jgi:hypothetical protein